MAEGVFALLGLARQNSFGVTNITSLEFIGFTDESITDAINVLRPETLTGNFFEVDAVRGLEDVSGDINMVMHPEMTGVLLRGVFGQSTPTSTTSGFWEHEFIPKNSNFEAGVALTPYTVEVFRDSGGGKAFQYTDSQLASMNIQIAVDDFAKLTISTMSRVGSLMNVVSGTAPSDAPFVYDQASVSLAGAAFIEFEDISIALENNIEGQQTLDGTRQHRFFQRTDKMTVRATGTMNFINNSSYVDYKAFNRKLLEINLKDTSVASGNEMNIQLPRFRFDEYTPSVGGPGRISVSFSATGEYDTSSNYAVRITMTNSRASYN